MADNVGYTPGAGATIAADDVGSGVLVQRVKLVTSADGNSTEMGETSVQGKQALWVDARPSAKKVVITPTVSSSPAYTAGDCIGGIQTITGAARANGLSGLITAVHVLDKTQAQRPVIDLLFFDVSPTSAGDNAAAAFSDSDMANCIGIIPIGGYNVAWAGTPLNSYATRQGVDLPYVCAGGDTQLYVQAVVRNTPTLTSTTDLIFIYYLYQD